MDRGSVAEGAEVTGSSTRRDGETEPEQDGAREPEQTDNGREPRKTLLALTKSAAISAPIPRLPPVIKQHLPSSLPISRGRALGRRSCPT